ncbi:MAG: hypothetical protein AAF604_16525 [Acidobacteriota bacterium]
MLADRAGRVGDHLLAALEVRLADQRAPVDLSVRLTRSGEIDPLAANLPAGPARSFLRFVSGRWASRRPNPWQDLPAVWVEFDCGPKDDPARPVICIELAPTFSERWLRRELLPALLLETPSKALWSGLVEVLRRLPSGSRPLYLFALWGRPGADLRVEIVGLPADRWPRFFRGLGEPLRAQSSQLPSRILSSVERPHLSFDLQPEGLGERLGFEGSFRRQPARDVRWSKLFDDLVRRDLATRPRADALLAFAGVDSLRSRAKGWPVGRIGRLVRCLSHVKLVARPENLEAKGYLLVQHVGDSVSRRNLRRHGRG